MDDASRAVLALTNRLVDVGVPPLRASEFWRLMDAVKDPSQLMGRTAAELAADLPGEGVEAERLAVLLDSGVALAVRLEALHERGIWTLTALDPGYPARMRDRLGPAAPPVLYGAGDASLLDSSAVGIVGTQEMGDERDLVDQVTRAGATAMAGAGLTVVSGGTPGVEQLAMDTATGAGGAAVAVLADSLERAIGRADVRRGLQRGRLGLCTPYGPDVRFSEANAAARHKIIYSLGRVTLVVASGAEQSRTWTGATEAIARRYGRVAVWRGPGEGPGHAALERAGALPVTDIAAVEALLTPNPSDSGDHSGP